MTDGSKIDWAEWEWTCACCGDRKRGVPDSSFSAPIHYAWAEQGDQDFVVIEKTDDHCVMDISGHRAFFIRCVLLVPVEGMADSFGFGVWSTLSEANFLRYNETFLDQDQSKLGPMFGYLANRLPTYPDTLNLKVDVLPQDDRQRPVLRLWDEAAEHPLFIDQNRGIDKERLTALLSEILPCAGRA